MKGDYESMKAEDVYSLYTVFNRLNDSDMSFDGSLNVIRNIDTLEPVFKTLEKKRVKLVEKYGPKDENGNVIKDDNGMVHIDGENLEKISAEIKKLYNMNVDVEILPISEDDLRSLSRISPKEQRVVQKYVIS